MVAIHTFRAVVCYTNTKAVFTLTRSGYFCSLVPGLL